MEVTGSWKLKMEVELIGSWKLKKEVTGSWNLKIKIKKRTNERNGSYWKLKIENGNEC